MDTFKGRKHSEVGPLSSSLPGWTHLKTPSTVKWAHHLLLLKHSEVGPYFSSLAGWTHLKASLYGLYIPRGLVAIKLFFFLCYYPHWLRNLVSPVTMIYRKISKFPRNLHGCINICCLTEFIQIYTVHSDI